MFCLFCFSKFKFDYFKFAEVINGRAATLGIISGKVVYTVTGSDFYTQIFSDPVSDLIVILGITMLISPISLYTFDKRNENDFFENLERVVGNWNMLSWFMNLTIMILHLRTNIL